MVYSGEAFKTYDRIAGNLNPIVKNRYYSYSDEFYFYINNKGYLHVLRLERVKSNGKKGYAVLDYLLTTNNTLKVSIDYGVFTSIEEARSKYFRVVKE